MSWNIKEIIEITQVTRFFETSVTTYPAVQCHIQDDRNPGLHDHSLCLIYFMYFNVKYSTDHVRNEDVLLRVKEQRNILHEIRKRKANWIGHILRRNCLLQRVTEGKIQGGIEVVGIQGRRCMKLLDDLKE